MRESSAISASSPETASRGDLETAYCTGDPGALSPLWRSFPQSSRREPRCFLRRERQHFILKGTERFWG